MLRVHAAARKHGIADDDILHAVTHALALKDHPDDTRLYLGPARDGTPLEVVTLRRSNRPEVAIHAMKMRRKYRRRLGGRQ